MPKIKRIKKYYRDFSMILLNTIILLIILNLLIYGVIIIKHSVANPDIGLYGYGDKVLAQLYPDMSESERIEFIAERQNHSFVYEPFVQHKEMPRYNSKYININEKGFRIIKDQCEYINNSKYNIFVFGGSTTQGYGVRDYETIPSWLQQEINDPNVCVYNFGRGGYYSVLERVFFESLIIKEDKPHAAIFIDGLNDYWYTEPMFTSQLKSLMNGEHLWDSSLSKIPMVKAINYLLPEEKRIFYPKFTSNKAYDELQLKKLTQRYLTNKQITESICKEFNIQCYFIIQPIPLYNYNLSNDIVYTQVYKQNFLKYKSQSHENIIIGYDILKKELKRANSDVIWLADIQKDLNESLYVDTAHYNPKFSKMIAVSIIKTINIPKA